MVNVGRSSNVQEPGLRYTIDGKRIAHQEVEGEVIVIDFVAGTYFSMQGTAGEIWQMLVAGVDAPTIAAHYRKDAPAGEIEAFLAELLAKTLIETGDAGAGEAVPAALLDRPTTYATPRLEIFEDLADLIMLDPVHDVTEAGWPHAPANGN
jgi:hypothetical protein